MLIENISRKDNFIETMQNFLEGQSIESVHENPDADEGIIIVLGGSGNEVRIGWGGLYGSVDLLQHGERNE